MYRKGKYLISIALGVLMFACCFFLIPKNLGTAYASGSNSDTYSFTSAGESSSAYYQNCGSVQDENRIIESNAITINYDEKDTSTNNQVVYQNVSSISVKTRTLPGWTAFIWGSHWLNSNTLYVDIYKGGTWKETLSANLSDNSTASIDLSGMVAKYGAYSFIITYKYEIGWQNWPNSGKKFIHYQSNQFKVQTEDISAKLTKTVYDETNSVYTDTIVNGGVYKTDNKNMKYQWSYTHYDNNSEDTLNVLGAVFLSDGTTPAGDDFKFTNNGNAGLNLSTLTNGTYILKLKTNLGKQIQYTLKIEPFERLLTINSAVRKDNLYCIENSSAITWTDTASVKSVKINDNTITNGQVLSPGMFGINWNVEYDIVVTRTTDATESYRIVFTNDNVVDLNLNQDSLTKSPIARWYETYLLDTEEKIYNSWASYDNILEFAIQRELDTVTTAYYDGGTWTAGIGMDDPLNRTIGDYYIYKKRDSATEKNAYFSYDALYSSVIEYAKASISNNTYFSKATPSTPHEGERIFKTRVENGVSYNLFLLGSFTLSKRPYVDLWINGVKQDFGYNNDITINTPGIYKIEEINPFDVSAVYYIYIQRSAPEIQYIMKGTSIQRTLSSENTRFGTYFDLILFDLDDDSLLVVEKAGIGSVANVYTYSELLALKNQNKLETNFLFDQSGQFTVTSINHWTAFAHIQVNTFTFYVSVNEPYINEPSVNREKNELTLSYGIPTGEYNTQITSVVIKKYIQDSEEWEILSVDSKGNSISPEIDTYIFNTQGYYLIQITDNFARTYEREYAFSREKPTALITVGNTNVELAEEDKGYYNKKVTITWYDNTITAKMYGIKYTWVDGVMVKTNINAEEYITGTAITSEGYYIVELIDIDYNSRRFTFFIDQTAPEMKLYSGSTEFSSGSYKNTDVKTEYVLASEVEAPISVNVKKDTFPIAYPDNGIFTDEGTYEIIVIDLSGNSTSYSFTIDKTAPAGQLYLEDGTEFAVNGITNKKVYCSWGETGITATCNDNIYYKGSLISSDNTYKIVLKDLAGNTTNFNFQINSNIPIIIMKTESGKVVANNTSVDEPFNISWEDPNYSYTIEIVKNGVASNFNNYTTLSTQMFKFEESGSYRFTFTNGIGVTYVYSINATMKPSAIITAGVDTIRAYDYTNKNVLVTISDRNSTVEVFLKDENNDYKPYTNWNLTGYTFTLAEDGEYKIVITNDFNQFNNYFFIIKTSIPKATITDDAGNTVSASAEVVGLVKIEYDKDEVAECKLYRNGEIVYGDISEVSDVGRYILYLTDKAGNQSSYNFSIKASDDLNTAGLVTLIALGLGVIALAVFLIMKFRRPFNLKK